MISLSRPPRRGTAVLTALLGLIIVVAAGMAIVATPGWSPQEMQVVAVVHDAQNPVLDVLALTINVLFGPIGAVVITILGLCWAILIARSWRVGARWLILLVVPWACAEALKVVVQRPRPDPALLTAMLVHEGPSFSFPSGHTAFAAALVCAVIFALVPVRIRSSAIAVGAVVVLATAWSRVYLGVHYPTDVIASMLLVPLLAVAVDRLTAGRGLFRPRPTDERRSRWTSYSA